MKRPQWIAVFVALALVAILYIFGRTVPNTRPATPTQGEEQADVLPTDSILAQARKKLTTAQVTRLNGLEHSIVRGDVKDQQLKVYHQLAHFWADTGQLFEPYAWYTAEAARLENSEKSLTFAAHLFLQNLRGENDPALRTWKAVQARDLFERSLKINPENDSSIVGLGACYIFGSISATPMEGILKVRSVAERDSTNLFAQEILAQASMLSGQFEKATARFETIYRLSGTRTEVKLEAALMLAEASEKRNDPKAAIDWYKKSLQLIKNDQIRVEVQKRIDELSGRTAPAKN